MKTLDEVIKGFECCEEINCAECPYANWDNTDVARCNDTEKEDDALHYLREYRVNQKTYDENSRKAKKARELYLESAEELNALRDYWAEQQENPALTWDELKQMEGKPVWVEWSEVIIGDYFQFHGWFLVEWINDNENEIIMQNKYGKRMTRHKSDSDWQAYRKERE